MPDHPSPWLTSVLAEIAAYVRSGLAVREAVAIAVREGLERTPRRRRPEQHELGIEGEE